MEPIDLLLQRNSAPKLSEPGPTSGELELILQAALRAPDHANLRPWRFIVIEGEARHRLGDLYARALSKRNPQATDGELEKAKAQPLRAPLLIAVVVGLQEHPKVPKIEQQHSAACAAHAILLAAEALGYGAIWRTGDNAFDRTVLQGLGLSDSEELVAYLYLGSRASRKPLPEHSLKDFVSYWPG